MKLSDSISSLRMVGPVYVKRLEKLGIFTIEDLLYHFPFRYDDYSIISPVSHVQIGETVTVAGKIEKIDNSYTKTRKKIQTAVLCDDTGKIQAIWFNQPYLIKTIKIGETYNFSGKCEWFGNRKVLLSPEYELIRMSTDIRLQTTTKTIHTGRLVPVYPETYGISSKWLRTRINTILKLFDSQIEEFLPPEIIQRENLIPEKQAINEIHFPTNLRLAEQAKYRLGFDELFLIQLYGRLKRNDWQKNKINKIFKIDPDKINDFIQKLPFELTNAQKRCINEILSDLKGNAPMNRLLQGDVGSGKTVVAAIAAYTSYLNGLNTILMAPTEILASQHFKTFSSLFSSYNIPVELITGSIKPKKQSTNSSQQIAKIFIGTHALLFQNFDPEKVGLVIADEQHRFGVEQRSVLAKKGLSPHFLTMTATPIPRTIALTLFGDLDFSVIDEMPKGRLKIKTWVVPKEKRESGYKWIRSQIKDTPNQAFIICPLIEESESLSDVKAVTIEFEKLSKFIFPDLKLGLLHGRIKPKEKDQLLIDFKEEKLDILVSTPVVEVGIDIPNATIMVIEAADRFGLAQLHQLRGRVGRNDLQSYCFLFTENQNPKVAERLKYLEITNIGIELAEADLKLRGPGEVYGTKQHGFPDLKIASFSDQQLILKTKEAVQSITILNSNLKNRLKKYKITNITNN